MNLKERVIKCIDVKDGRVVKGVKLVDMIDEGDKVEEEREYDEEGEEELWFIEIKEY